MSEADDRRRHLLSGGVRVINFSMGFSGDVVFAPGEGILSCIPWDETSEFEKRWFCLDKHLIRRMKDKVQNEQKRHFPLFYIGYTLRGFS